jgi:hypothetical protein
LCDPAADRAEDPNSITLHEYQVSVDELNTIVEKLDRLETEMRQLLKRCDDGSKAEVKLAKRRCSYCGRPGNWEDHGRPRKDNAGTELRKEVGRRPVGGAAGAG